MLATSLALIAQEFHGRERGTAYGIWGATVSAAAAIGPMIGGVLTQGLRLGVHLLHQPADRRGGDLPLDHAAGATPRTRMPRAWTGPAWSRSPAGLFLLVLALIRGNDAGWGSTQIVAELVGSRGAAAAVRGGRGAPEAADARPHAVPQAHLQRRRDRRLRRVGLAVRHVPLHHALLPERPRLHAGADRPALPAADRGRVLRRAGGRAGCRTELPPRLSDGRRAGPGGARTAADARRHRATRPGPRCSAGFIVAGSRPRHPQPDARPDRGGRGPARPQRHGLRDQQHRPPGRRGHRHRRPGRAVPAQGAGEGDRASRRHPGGQLRRRARRGGGPAAPRAAAPARRRRRPSGSSS